MLASLVRDCLFRGGIHKPIHKPRKGVLVIKRKAQISSAYNKRRWSCHGFSGPWRNYRMFVV